MSKVKDKKLVVDYDSRTIIITNTITVQDISSIISELTNLERQQDDWPRSTDIEWTVVISDNVSQN
jgi:hypothetical protein